MLFIFAVLLFSSFFKCFLRLKFWPPTLLFTTFSLLTQNNWHSQQSFPKHQIFTLRFCHLQVGQ